MDIEKLIEELQSVAKHPESVLGQAATALSTLQDKNEKLRAKLEQVRCGS